MQNCITSNPGDTPQKGKGPHQIDGGYVCQVVLYPKGSGKGRRVEKRQGNGSKGKDPTPEGPKGSFPPATAGFFMFTLFQRKRVPPSTGVPHTVPALKPKARTRPESAASLLATPRRRKLLVHIWQRTSLSRPQFVSLYRTPLERYAELVQQFPASESHHHAYPGGMLDHGLEIVAYALKLRQSYLLPAGASPETQVAQAEAWTAVTGYAPLLHDIGKIAVDLHVDNADGTPCHPLPPPPPPPYPFRSVHG